MHVNLPNQISRQFGGVDESGRKPGTIMAENLPLSSTRKNSTTSDKKLPHAVVHVLYYIYHGILFTEINPTTT